MISYLDILLFKGCPQGKIWCKLYNALYKILRGKLTLKICYHLLNVKKGNTKL